MTDTAVQTTDRHSSSPLSFLRVEAVSKSFQSARGTVPAIHSISFDVGQDEFVSIVGPSGCGKTTLLKCISGLMTPSGGRVTFRGKNVTSPPEDLAIVFQDYSRSLFPWLSVKRNVELPIAKRRADTHTAVEEALEAVGLAAFADHYPWQLSGGMQQRVAIARALAYKPALLLMDEPFASVDAQTRGDLEDLVLRIRRKFGVTVVLVTHDIDESVYMGDRVIILGKPPTTVQQELLIDLPPVRDQIATKELPAFAHLRTKVYRAIKDARPGDDPR